MRGYLHMEGVIEGPIGTELLEGFRGRGLVGLAFTYSGGAQGVATSDREIRGPEDLKGRRIGVYGSDVDRAWLSALGAQPVALDHSLPTFARLAQEGGIDSAVVTWRRVRDAQLKDRYRYVSLMHSSYLTSVTYINEKFFEGLPEGYRELVKRSALTAARVERARTIELNETSKHEVMARGMRPVHLSAAAHAGFVEALRPVYEGALDQVVGKDLIERIRGTGDSPQLPSGLDFADPKNSVGRFPPKELATRVFQDN